MTAASDAASDADDPGVPSAPMVHLLAGALKHYDWGSHETIARLTGRGHPTEQPEAELWFGAHVQGPASLPGLGTDLATFVARDPRAALGAQVADRFGGQLPFLLKVLAPVRALSIQAHPDEARAAAAPTGTYVDGWPKPEGVLAVTEFEIFAGLLGVERTAELARRCGAHRLGDLIRTIADPGRAADDDDVARRLLHRLLHLADDERAALVEDTVAAARGHRDDPHLGAVARIADQFPGDPGLLVLMTMRHRILAPGEFVFVPAGVLHAYVRGAGVEVMASSDNVVRAGLTSKRIDVDELERIVDVALQVEPETPTEAHGWSVFPAETPFFRLHVGNADAVQGDPGVGRPRILLALAGGARLVCGQVTLSLSSGDAVFVGAGEPPIVLDGAAEVLLATPGD